MELLLGPFECKFAKGCRFDVGVLFDPDLFLGRLFLGVLKLLVPILPKAETKITTVNFCQIASKLASLGFCKCFFIFKVIQTVTRHKYDQPISQKHFCQDFAI
jgi:hypothetical protein